jgi:magnesium and cobalt exporter, CNNM family
MTGLWIYFFIALVVSFVCSLLEAVLFSVPHGAVEAFLAENRPGAERLKSLKDRIDRPLAAILTLNTVANTVGAAGVGAQALKVSQDYWPNSRHGLVVAAASAILTFCILVFSEIIPKTLGAVHCRRLALRSGWVLSILVWLLAPVVWLTQHLSNWIRPHHQPMRLSRQEMLATAQLGSDEGAIHARENKVIQNLLRLRSIRVRDILTPRSVVTAFKHDRTVGQVVVPGQAIRFSRLPVYGKDLDDITGVVHRHKIHEAFSSGSVNVTLASLAMPIHAVPDSKSVSGLLEHFIQRQEQMFLVVDEYGGCAGIVTLEDAVETLLGVEIVDEFDSVRDMRILAAELSKQRNQRRFSDGNLSS